MKILETKHNEEMEWQEISLTVKELISGFKDGGDPEKLGKDFEITGFNNKIIIKPYAIPDLDLIDQKEQNGKGRDTIIWWLENAGYFGWDYAAEDEDGRWFLLSGYQKLLVICRYAVNSKDPKILNTELKFIVGKADRTKVYEFFKPAIETKHLVD